MNRSYNEKKENKILKFFKIIYNNKIISIISAIILYFIFINPNQTFIITTQDVNNNLDNVFQENSLYGLITKKNGIN
jgi:hypothetical protein